MWDSRCAAHIFSRRFSCFHPRQVRQYCVRPRPPVHPLRCVNMLPDVCKRHGHCFLMNYSVKVTFLFKCLDWTHKGTWRDVLHVLLHSLAPTPLSRNLILQNTSGAMLSNCYRTWDVWKFLVISYRLLCKKESNLFSIDSVLKIYLLIFN